MGCYLHPISIHFDRAIMNDSDKIRISEEKSNKLFQMFHTIVWDEL